MNTIQDVSEKTLKIEAVLTSANEGEYFSYDQLERQSSVRMDQRGKGYLRIALKRLKMPYETVKGTGVKLLCSQNASRIVVSKVVKIDNSIKRAERTTNQVRDRVFDQLTEPEKKNILFLGALFGTIRSYSQSAKKIFSNEPLKVGGTVTK